MIRIKAFSLALCLSAGSAVALSATQTRATPGICKDGTTTTATGRGTCSGHGGVDKAATKAARKQAKAELKAARAAARRTAATSSMHNRRAAPLPRASARARERANENSRVAGSGSSDDNNPSGAIAQCKDGMYSHAQRSRGSCGHHGGVARWM